MLQILMLPRFLEFVLATSLQPPGTLLLVRLASRPVVDVSKLERTAWCGGSACEPHALYLTLWMTVRKVKKTVTYNNYLSNMLIQNFDHRIVGEISFSY